MFDKISAKVSQWIGESIAFSIAVLLIGLWAVSGFAIGFNNSWQLIINTGTTVLTWLMLFLLQNTQNRDTRAIQAKLDELIRCIDEADESVIEEHESS